MYYIYVYTVVLLVKRQDIRVPYIGAHTPSRNWQCAAHYTGPVLGRRQDPLRGAGPQGHVPLHFEKSDVVVPEARVVLMNDALLNRVQSSVPRPSITPYSHRDVARGHPVTY